MPSSGDLRARIAAARTNFFSEMDGGGLVACQKYAVLLEDLLTEVFAGSAPKGAALCAVGSLARGRVAPYGDLDVRLVVGAGLEEEEVATRILYPLWDSGLEVGHRPFSLDDSLVLAETDLATATELLEMRVLQGPFDEEAHKERVREALFAEAHLAQFLDRLSRELSGRHKRFGDSVFVLEPEVKLGPGGLRDLDVARWALRARYGLSDWGELVRVAGLLAREGKALAEAEAFLWDIRARLHERGGRRVERLTFDEQEELGMLLGFGETRAAAAEELMQTYYRHARFVGRMAERLLDRLKPVRRKSTPTLSSFAAEDHVPLGGTEADLLTDPCLALRAYLSASHEQKPISPYAREAITKAASDPKWCELLRTNPSAGPLFVDLLTEHSVPTHAGSFARESHDTGLLLAMLPEFAPVAGRVHHDLYHVYTVDTHSVRAVELLESLRRGEHATMFPLASRLAAETARPRVLVMATLLHDVGKGYPDEHGSRKNHAAAGANLARSILPRLGFCPEEISDVATLIREHLAMYHAATRRDIEDPETLEVFAASVGSRETLRELYVLTVVDIATTSPTAMTEWKATMLAELYLATDRFLRGLGRASGALARLFEDTRRDWEGDPEALRTYLESMPERYIHATSPARALYHARQALSDRTSVAMVPQPRPGVFEVCVVAQDEPGLLCRIAGALTAERLEVLGAEIYSRSHKDGEQAVDLFWVREREDMARLLERVESNLVSLGKGELSVEGLIASRTGSRSPWRERPSPPVPTEVTMDDRGSVTSTIVEVFAKDRVGLLYVLARTFFEFGVTIVLSRINTEGNKVADVFYVRELSGSKLGRERRDTLKVSILEALERMS